MVWFHGGGNEPRLDRRLVPLPASAASSTTAHVLAEQRDVVVVTANYRLGVFGFFAPRRARRRGRGVAATPATRGCSTSSAALAWVRDNIAAFGGDPKQRDDLRRVRRLGRRLLPGRVARQPRALPPRDQRERRLHDAAGDGRRGAAIGRPRSRRGRLRQRRRPARVPARGAGGDDSSQPRRARLRPDGRRRLPARPAAHAFRDGRRRARCRTSSAPTPTRARSSSSAFRRSPARRSTSPRSRAASARAPTEIAAVYPASTFATPQDALERVVGDSGLVCGTYDTARRAAAGGRRTYLYNFARVLPIPILVALDWAPSTASRSRTSSAHRAADGRTTPRSAMPSGSTGRASRGPATRTGRIVRATARSSVAALHRRDRPAHRVRREAEHRSPASAVRSASSGGASTTSSSTDDPS